MSRLYWTLWLLLPFSCANPQTDNAGLEDSPFGTSAPSRLYFKNIRQSQYLLENKAGSDIDFYIHRGFTRTPLTIIPIIADDWMRDRATIIFRRMEDNHPLPFLAARIYRDGGPDSLICNATGPDCSYELARTLYLALRDHQEIELSTNPQANWRVWPGKGRARSAAEAVLRDYFKLVDTDFDH